VNNSLGLALVFWYGSTLVSSGQYAVTSIVTVFSMLLFTTANVNAILAFGMFLISNLAVLGWYSSAHC
jgi:hypothetical protein